MGAAPAVSESYAVKVSKGDREYMRLYCVAEGDREQVRAQIDEVCRQKLIVYARPKEIVFMDKMPRTAVGKVDVGKIREKISAD